ncbi:hypothetical protein BDN70DRAFT_264388 [Pholiota conissans]|uniref:Uncharacterized protein n=1 Tax=Pholiota conissans TaxID=109636 RepID=A0A9P6CX85_9AGAR|nr:hypothetical protein BDN70DRAFT_264388 [Pholiota conissans]
MAKRRACRDITETGMNGNGGAETCNVYLFTGALCGVHGQYFPQKLARAAVPAAACARPAVPARVPLPHRRHLRPRPRPPASPHRRRRALAPRHRPRQLPRRTQPPSNAPLLLPHHHPPAQLPSPLPDRLRTLSRTLSRPALPPVPLPHTPPAHRSDPLCPQHPPRHRRPPPAARPEKQRPLTATLRCGPPSPAFSVFLYCTISSRQAPLTAYPFSLPIACILARSSGSSAQLSLSIRPSIYVLCFWSIFQYGSPTKHTTIHSIYR